MIAGENAGVSGVIDRARCPDGKVRVCRKGTALPEGGYRAQTQVKGKWVTGALQEREKGCWAFLPDREAKNWGVFDISYRTRRGYVKKEAEFSEDPIHKGKSPVREILTLWDLAYAEGEIRLTKVEVDQVIKGLGSYAQVLSRDFFGSAAASVLRAPKKLSLRSALKSVQVRPWFSLSLTGNWESEVREIIEALR